MRSSTFAWRWHCGTKRTPILKERMFGLTNLEGNHGEDVKEYYFFLDGTPTHSYMKMLYKYPQVAYPYGELVEVNARRRQAEPEFDSSTRCVKLSLPIAASMCSSNMPRRTPKTSSTASQPSIADAIPRRFISCRISGIGTLDMGTGCAALHD